jgi:hypothetical protein
MTAMAREAAFILQNVRVTEMSSDYCSSEWDDEESANTIATFDVNFTTTSFS